MKINIQNLLSDSSARAQFFAQYFAVFAVIYHVAFIILFKIYGITPMVLMNFYSVPFFSLLAFISPKAKSYILIYIFSCLEVYTHQILGVYCLGIDSGFHYFFIPFALLPLYTFKNKILPATFFSLLGGAVFFLIEAYANSFPAIYTVPEVILNAINLLNIALAVVIILSSVIIYAFVASHSEMNLENQVEQKTNKVLVLQAHTVNSLANLVESRDADTGEHIQRISVYTELLAKAAFARGLYSDTITEDFIKLLKRAAPLHDIGKIVVTDVILKKPGKLTLDEFEIIKTHTTEGKKIVKEIIGISDDKEYIKIAEDVALCHHERWDGNGYPNHLKSYDIPLSARIIAIADVFDALTSERCYKKAFPVEEAFAIIKEEAGTHFDPALIEVFVDIKDDFVALVNSQR